VYSDTSITEGAFYNGEIAYYGPGGYYFDFPVDKLDARALIKDLEYNTWLNHGTRALFVDFGVYNGNLNAICLVKYVQKTCIVTRARIFRRSPYKLLRTRRV